MKTNDGRNEDLYLFPEIILDEMSKIAYLPSYDLLRVTGQFFSLNPGNGPRTHAVKILSQGRTS